MRAVHAKAHAILEATLTIDAGLPPELAQGLFAMPGDHRALLRLSTNPGDIIHVSGRHDGIRETLREDIRAAHMVWELRVQLNRDLAAMPIEDSTVAWDEAASPFVRVATLAAAPQDSWDGPRVEEVDERERFSVWTGLAAHQPLGGINRARKDTYEHSATFRARVNGCPIHEPA